MNKKLYVGNLSYDATDDQLQDLFSQAGTVVSAKIIRYQDTGKSKGFGFVEMETEEQAQEAINMFHQQDFMERKMVVNEARPPRPRGERGGGGRGGFNRRGGNNRRGGYRNDNYGGNGGDDFGGNGGDDMGMM